MSNIHHNPRVESVNDFVSFDYKQLFPGNDSVSQFYDLFSHPVVPIVAVFLYLTLSKTLLEGIRKTFNLKPKGIVVQGITIVHSALLAVYSGWTCYYSWGIVFPYVVKHGFVNAICDVSGELWNAKDLRYWVTHFYISKYYEFIDTW
ncbi:hypothetical protein EON65_21780 [archaeon]|nr:MAG: hypothetical protein EON65_21780 [archaeon]